MHDAAETRRAQLHCGELAARAGLAHHVHRIVRVHGREQRGGVERIERDADRTGNSQGVELFGRAHVQKTDPGRAQRFGELFRGHALDCDLRLPERARDRRLARAAFEIGRDRLVDARRHGQVEIVHDGKELLAGLARDARVEAPFLADAAHPASLVVVGRIDEDLLVEREELLGDARPQRLRAPVLEIGAPAAADEEGVAGEDPVAPQVRDASRRMPGGGDRENFLVAEEDHVAVLEQAVVALRIAVPADRGLRAGGPLERVRGGHVVGVHVGLERVLESETVLAQETHVALDLLGDRIDQDSLVV